VLQYDHYILDLTSSATNTNEEQRIAVANSEQEADDILKSFQEETNTSFACYKKNKQYNGNLVTSIEPHLLLYAYVTN
jgi:hypothetical protein